MSLILSATGWITESPRGNRLRWLYPTGKIDGSKFLGFPKSIIVERAVLDERIPDTAALTTSSHILEIPHVATVPLSWWDDLGTVSLSGSFPLIYKLSSPIQALNFVYHGLATRMLIRDSNRDKIVADRNLLDGDSFYFETSAMDEFVFLAFSVKLDNFRTLDMFKDRELDWLSVAEISVAETLKSDFDEVQKRYDNPTSLSFEEWEKLKNIAVTALESTPITMTKDEPTPWQIFDTILGLRWEFALLYGSGFFDGPHSVISTLDKMDDLLKDMPHQPVAYRVREKKSRVEKSNIVVCPPTIAKPLVTPSIPQYIDPKVSLTDKGNFNATLLLRWQQFDARAIGVEVEEEISASPLSGSIEVKNKFQNRSHRTEDSPFVVNLERSLDVPFYDVFLSSRICALDAWDRTSAFSSWSFPIPLSLIHQPWPPSPASAYYDELGKIHIKIQTAKSGLMHWSPDVVVSHSFGEAILYRSQPGKRMRNEIVNVSTPVFVKDGIYKTIIAPSPANPFDFENGYILAGRLKLAITKILGSALFFEIPDEGSGSSILFSAGQGTLIQNPKHPSLWTEIKKFPVIKLPLELVCEDPFEPADGKTDIASFHIRLSYLGRLGPSSNIVYALRIPSPPIIPPPFSVELLGIDFYNRTMVRVRFTEPADSGTYSVWWAEGLLNNDQFALVSVPGLFGSQIAYKGRVLYDLLSLPIPRLIDRMVTIGVQQVNQGQGQSKFQTVHIIIKGN